MNAGVYTDTLYLTDDITYIEKTMVNPSRDPELIIKAVRFAVVHEFFHLVQKKTMGFGKYFDYNFAYLRRYGLWIIEGTATWFEDEIYDNEDPYIHLKQRNGVEILRAGLNAFVDKSVKTTGPYRRFSFYKFVNSRCSNFSMKKLLLSLSNDRGDIKNLTNAFGEGCDFGYYLGVDKKSSLETALFYYQYATQYLNHMAWLESNENTSTYNFRSSRLLRVNNTNLTQFEDLRRIELTEIYTLPAYGARSFWIDESVFNQMYVDEITKDEAVLRLKTAGDKPLTVSVLQVPNSDSMDTGVSGNTAIINTENGNHDYYQSNEICESEYIFDGDIVTQLKPKYFITLVNPNESPVEIDELSFEIRPAKYVRDDAKEVVRSRGMGLMWQDDIAAKTVKLPLFRIQSTNGEWIHIDEDGVDDAVEYCTKELNSQKFAGYENWENPSLTNFYSFLNRKDYENNYLVGSNVNAQRLFENVVPDFYWTTFSEELLSQSIGTPDQIWMPGDFKIPLNHLRRIGVGKPGYVRCVRKMNNSCYKTP